MVPKKAKCAKLRRPLKFNPITASVHKKLIKRKRALFYMYFLSKNPAARRKGGCFNQKFGEKVAEGATLITTLLCKNSIGAEMAVLQKWEKQWSKAVYFSSKLQESQLTYKRGEV